MAPFGSPVANTDRPGGRMRIILYTGKGGVGKTSVSAASGLRASQLGHNTLVISTDPAHSLADSFDTPLGPEPVQVAPKLWGQEVDVLHEVDRHWGTVREWIAAVMQWQGVGEVLSDEIAILPGMEELVGLLHITEHYDRGVFDTMIIDCAPTGETLRLLSFPEVARWYMSKIFPLERLAARTLGTIARPVLRNIPMPGSEVFTSIEYLFRQIDKMREILVKADTSSVRLVVNAEKMVIQEAQRAYTYLNLYGYSTDLVVCNRLIPLDTEGAFLAKWKGIQAKHRALVGEAFSPIPIKDLPMFDQEVVGLPMLRLMGQTLFGDSDPADIYFHGTPQRVFKENDNFVLALAVPFMEREDIKVLQTGDELVIQAKQYRRSIVLPRALAYRSVSGAKLENGTLRVTFAPSAAEVAARSKSKHRKKKEESHGRTDGKDGRPSQDPAAREAHGGG